MLVAVVHLVLVQQGLTVNAMPAQMFQSLAVCAGNGVISYYGLACARRHASRSMYLLSAAGGLIILANLVRISELLFGSGFFSLLQFNWQVSVVIFAHMLAIIFLNAGYAGFITERAARAGVKARESQKAAEERSYELSEMIRERDQMILLNSRFTALSGISFFTSAIIHELSQPLQALKLAVYGLTEETKNSPQLAAQADFVARQTGHCDEIIRALRRIMIRGSAETQAVDLAESLRALLPVLRTQMEINGIVFEGQIPSSPVIVDCNAVLFQRIVFNLVANAMDALSNKESARLKLTLETGDGRACMAVCDNSGRVTDFSALNLATLAASDKPDGMGVGLMLSEKLAQQWGGRLIPSLKGAEGEQMTVFSLDLPLAGPNQGLA
jgi:C4-dicarboxylate-specific signal transduction histidine kinase